MTPLDVLESFESTLLGCLCALLDESGRPVCACHRYHGASPAPADRCGPQSTGQAWMRRGVSTWNPDDETSTFAGIACDAPFQTTLDLGVYRCVTALPDENGTAPPVQAYEADAEKFNLDRQTLWAALCCAMETLSEVPELDGAVSILASQVAPIDTSGACGGSILTVEVKVDPTADPEPEDEVMVSRPAATR